MGSKALEERTATSRKLSLNTLINIQGFQQLQQHITKNWLLKTFPHFKTYAIANRQTSVSSGQGGQEIDMLRT